jgi:hypothetical protein
LPAFLSNPCLELFFTPMLPRFRAPRHAERALPVFIRIFLTWSPFFFFRASDNNWWRIYRNLLVLK